MELRNEGFWFGSLGFGFWGGGCVWGFRVWDLRPEVPVWGLDLSAS